MKKTVRFGPKQKAVSMYTGHTPMSKYARIGFALFLFAGAAACEDPAEEEDPCAGADTTSAVLGNGVGGAFAAFANNTEVALSVAPQGGFGVSVIVRTDGLRAGSTDLGSVQLNVEDEAGVVIGQFLQENQPIACRGSDIGGEVRNVVVGFDPNDYKTPEELATLHNKIVTLAVTVTDPDGRQAEVRTPVTIVVEN